MAVRMPLIQGLCTSFLGRLSWCHFVFERLYIGDEPMALETDWDEALLRLCDRYEGGLDEAAPLVAQLEVQLIRGNTYKQYLVG